MAQDLFTYDWQMEGVPAVFLVEMNLDEDGRKARPFLLYIKCASPAGPLGPRQAKKLAALEKKLHKQAEWLFAGSIEDAQRKAFFFYVKDDKEDLALAQGLLDREKSLRCTAACKDDPEGEIYRKLLYPDAARLFTEQNRKQIQFMQKKGDALTPARRVTLHAFFPAEPLMGRFAEAARQAGFAVGEYEFEPEQPLPYGVTLHRISTLEKSAMDALTTEVIYLAARFDGALQYWSCPVAGRLR